MFECGDVEMIVYVVNCMGKIMDIYYFWEDYFYSFYGSFVNWGFIFYCCIEIVVLYIVLLCKNCDDFVS